MCISQELRTIFIFGGKQVNRWENLVLKFNSATRSNVFPCLSRLYADLTTTSKASLISTLITSIIIRGINYTSTSLIRLPQIPIFSQWSRELIMPCSSMTWVESWNWKQLRRVFNWIFIVQKNRKIYIFGGQRGKEVCTDFLKYDIDAKTITSVQTSSSESSDASGQSIFSGLSLASIDVNRGEVFALLRDSLWIFSLSTSEWSMIYKNKVHSCSSPECFVFDSEANKHFIVKSNAEFCLELSKPSRDNIFSYCKYLIRKQNYEEITHTDSINALMFLRNNLAETIDQNDGTQVNDFHKLASLLFCNKADDSTPKAATPEDISKTRNQRSALFNKLIELLPESKCQPRPNLCNFINI